MVVPGTARARSTNVAELGVELPGVVGEAPLAQVGHTPPEVGVGAAARVGGTGDDQRRVGRRTGQGVADAPEATAGRLGVGVEDLVEEVEGEGQIGVADDAHDGGALGALALGGEGRHELGLTHGAEVLGSVGPVAGAALHEHRRHDGGDRVGVGPELLEPVGAGQTVEVVGAPQVVMGVDDPSGRVTRHRGHGITLPDPYPAMWRRGSMGTVPHDRWTVADLRVRVRR